MPIQQNCTLDDNDISYAFIYFTIRVPKYVQYFLLQFNILHILIEHQTEITRENLPKISQKPLEIARESLHSPNFEFLSRAEKGPFR